MGCTASRLDNEGSVGRCRERRRFMEVALCTRHSFAAALSDYFRSLKIIGSALAIFAAGEPISVSDQTPPVLLPKTQTTTAGELHSYPPPSPAVSRPPSVALDSPNRTTASHQRRRKRKMKVPHILSESSDDSPNHLANSSSQTSSNHSIMDYEKWVPPSPPASDEYFNHRQSNGESREDEDETNQDPEIQQQEDEDHDLETEDDFKSSVHTAPPSPSALMPAPETSENVASSSATGQYDDDNPTMIRHRDLTEMAAFIKQYFDKAADAGEQVSEMLETGRDQLDRSFRQLKKTVYHSRGLLRPLSSNRFELDSIGEQGGSKSLASTLGQLLSCEKKLYGQVQAREGVRIELEKKLSALRSLETQGGDEAKQRKTKASIQKLQSQMNSTSQAASETSTAIVGLLDAELVPQLTELCHGFMCMWRSMNQYHEAQNRVVQQVHGLVNQSTTGESTSDLHHQATRDLESAVSVWYTSFSCLMKYQKEFITSLHGWYFNLTDTEETNINGSQPWNDHLIFAEWKLALGRLSDTDTDTDTDTEASKAIRSFINVVHSISLKQADEMKLKKRTESASKELEKTMSSLTRVENKYDYSNSMVGLRPGSWQENRRGLGAWDLLSQRKTELVECQKRVQEEMAAHSRAVEATRPVILSHIQTGLPEVFQAMTSFSGMIMNELEGVCNRSSATHAG